MALRTDRSDNPGTTTQDAPEPASALQRRDMSLVWWSTYWSLLFLAFFVYGVSVLAGVLRDPQPMEIVAAALGGLALVPWALAVLGARHGVERGTFRTSGVLLAVVLAACAAVISLWTDDLPGAGALPLALVLATVSLSLARGRWWLILLVMCLPVAHVSVATTFIGTPSDARELFTMAWLSFFMVLGVPTSLWVWGVMVELDVTRQRAADLAITNERLRFAADLHDVQGHHLQVISLKTDLASRLLAKDRPDAAAPHILEAHDAAQTALQETRALVQGYRKTTLTQELNNASSVLESAGVTTHVDIPALVASWAQDPEATERSSVLGLVVREATTNTLRHSRANAARFGLKFAPGNGASGSELVALSIQNDGAPPPPQRASPAASNSGLDGLRRRVEGIGGTLSTHHDGDETFALDVSVPRTTRHATTHTEDTSP